MSALLPTLLLLHTCSSLNYNIGFMLSTHDSYKVVYESMIPYAVDKFNANSTTVQLSPQVNVHNEARLYSTYEAGCDLLSRDIVAVISPDNSNTIGIEVDIFHPLDMPLIVTGATDSHLHSGGRDKFLLLPPTDDFQAQAILDLLTSYEWTDLSIITSDTNYGIHGITALQQLLSEATANTEIQEEFVVSTYFFRGVEDPEQIELDDTLQNVVASLARVFILHCEAKYAPVILRSAHEKGLLDKGFVWIVTEGITSSPESLKLLDGFYRSYYDGLIGISLYIDKISARYKTFKDDLLSVLHVHNVTASDLTPAVVRTYDAIQILGRALEGLSVNGSVSPAPSSCGETAWEGGTRVFDAMTKMQYKGPSGSYASHTGRDLKTSFGYSIVNWKNPGQFDDIGMWSTKEGLVMSRKPILYLDGATEKPLGTANSLEGQHIKIGVVHGPPFSLNRNGCPENDCWSGICPEAIARLASELNFTYEYISPEDGEYGTQNDKDGKWSGLIGDLLMNRIDMIAMDLAVSSQRSAFIDFTYSYMDSGISLIVKGESGTSNNFFFLSPFDSMTWAAIIISIVIIALFQNIFNKLSPFGVYGRRVHALQACGCRRCIEKRRIKTEEHCRFKDQKEYTCLVEEVDGDLHTASMSVYNALWVIGGGFVGHAGETLPRSPSGRFILFSWWFFAMLIVSMYTANLTAFMTLDKQGITISTATDLLTQRDYAWGLVPDEFTGTLLSSHSNPLYRDLAAKATPVKGFDEGVDKVGEGKFVFVDETAWLQYSTIGKCDTFFVGGELQTIPYAFGLPRNSPYARLLNKQILLYREEGYFSELWKVWGVGKDTCGHDGMGNNETLTFFTLIGIFYFLVLGLAISLLFLVIEIVVATLQDSPDHPELSFWAKLKRRTQLKLEDLQTEWPLCARGSRQENGNALQIIHATEMGPDEGALTWTKNVNKGVI